MAKRILITIATWHFNNGRHNVSLLVGEKDRDHDVVSEKGFTACLDVYSSFEAVPSECAYKHIEKETRAIAKCLAPRADITIRYSVHDLRERPVA